MLNQGIPGDNSVTMIWTPSVGACATRCLRLCESFSRSMGRNRWELESGYSFTARSGGAAGRAGVEVARSSETTSAMDL